MDSATADEGSFRDPSGRLYRVGDRIFRTVMPRAADDFDFVRASGFFDAQVKRGNLVSLELVEPDTLGSLAEGARYVLEHPKLPFISFPYEWPFSLLKAAALLQLDLHIDALDYDVNLSDASAYNVQFRGARPVFIDTLSFKRYREGEFWLAHRQFCEQFLNPLLLRSLIGVPHNEWYRGALEGITAQALRRVLPWQSNLSWNVLTHVVLQARLQSASSNQQEAQRLVKQRKLPRAAFRQMLSGLRRWIGGLEPSGEKKTVWSDYARDNSYASNEARLKREFVASFAAALRPSLLWDIGCNTGDYSEVALDAGAGLVVGFDADQRALDLAVARGRAEDLNFLPLYLDAANPPPSQGWAQQERPGLSQRAECEAILALAIVHHLAIGRNIPLPAVVNWLVGMAPQGVIEFVQKSDPMVQRLLQLRDDIFEDYQESTFMQALEARADIVKSLTVSASGRRLFWFRRR